MLPPIQLDWTGLAQARNKRPPRPPRRRRDATNHGIQAWSSSSARRLLSCPRQMLFHPSKQTQMASHIHLVKYFRIRVTEFRSSSATNHCRLSKIIICPLTNRRTGPAGAPTTAEFQNQFLNKLPPGQNKTKQKSRAGGNRSRSCPSSLRFPSLRHCTPRSHSARARSKSASLSRIALLEDRSNWRHRTNDPLLPPPRRRPRLARRRRRCPVR